MICPPRLHAILSVFLFFLISTAVYITYSFSFHPEIADPLDTTTTPQPTPWIHPDFYTPHRWIHPTVEQAEQQTLQPNSAIDPSDNFPYAARLKSPVYLPPIPSWNTPRSEPYNALSTAKPLLIPYTTSWPLLQQTIVSFLTAGWPASAIHVLNNAPSPDALSPGLDVYRLIAVFRVNVMSTPKRLSDGELRRFVLETAVEEGWNQYFVAADNTIALVDEKFGDAHGSSQSTSLYARAIEAVQGTEEANEKWARISLGDSSTGGGALVAYNTRTLASLPDDGLGLPSFTDCSTDLEIRYSREQSNAMLHPTRFASPGKGKMLLFSVEEALEDLLVLYRRKAGRKWQEKSLRAAIVESKLNVLNPWGEEDERGGQGWRELVSRVKGLRRARGGGRC